MSTCKWVISSHSIWFSSLSLCVFSSSWDFWNWGYLSDVQIFSFRSVHSHRIALYFLIIIISVINKDSKHIRQISFQPRLVMDVFSCINNYGLRDENLNEPRRPPLGLTNSVLGFVSLVLVRPAEWVHWAKGDVCWRGLHEPGQRTTWWAALAVPGCRSGR